MDMNPLDLEAVFRMLLALAAGGILGYERSAKGIDAGFRTHIIVCMASYAVMLTNIHMYLQYQTGDPTRMPAQVISGVGFLGAGCILVTKSQRIKGVTTAAGLWAAACLGLCIGAGNYVVSVCGIAAVFLTLTLFHFVDDSIFRHTRNMRFYAEFESAHALTDFMRYLKEQDIRVTDIDSMDRTVAGCTVIVISIRLRTPISPDTILADFENRGGIVYIAHL
jgi:putative Mg2+ transporter-C (MgtC) family protein